MYYQKSNQRIPDIYRQKLNYEKHINKLGQLSRRHSYNSSCHRQQIIDQYRMRKQQSFNRRTFNNQQKITKQNSLIFDKLSKGTRSSIAPLSQSVEGRLTHQSLRKRVQYKTDNDNLQLYHKLNALTPSINNKKFQSDYQKSVQIRNRISRFQKNQTQNSSILKLNKYFQLSSRSTPASRRDIQSLNLPSNDKSLSTHKGFKTPTNKLSTFKSKINLEYKKQDINKNKIVDKWDLLRKRKFLSVKQPISQQINRQKISGDIASKNKQRISEYNIKNKKLIGNDQVFPTEA